MMVIVQFLSFHKIQFNLVQISDSRSFQHDIIIIYKKSFICWRNISLKSDLIPTSASKNKWFED